MAETARKVEIYEQEINNLNAKLLQITAQRDEYKEQLEYKQKPQQAAPAPPKGIVGAIAGFFATESELKKWNGT